MLYIIATSRHFNATAIVATKMVCRTDDFCDQNINEYSETNTQYDIQRMTPKVRLAQSCPENPMLQSRTLKVCHKLFHSLKTQPGILIEEATITDFLQY